MQIRAIVLCVLFAAVFTAFSAKLVKLQVVEHEHYAKLAEKQSRYTRTIPARRGMIVDRHGEILAANVPAKRVVLDPSLSWKKDPQALAEIVALHLERDVEELTTLLANEHGKVKMTKGEKGEDVEEYAGRKYIVLEAGLPIEKVHALQAELNEVNKDRASKRMHSLMGISYEDSTRRNYPNGSTLAHVLGYLALDNPNNGDSPMVPKEGVERSMNAHLSGIDGYIEGVRDRRGVEIMAYRKTEKLAQEGKNVQLTIDMGLQTIVEEEIDAACRMFNPVTANIIILDPHTGEILAMASRPNYNPNKLRVGDDTRNHSIMDRVEPGSTFKIVVTSAALNEGTVTKSTLINCENGSWIYGGRPLRDTASYGMLSVRDVLVKSSNIGSAKMALQLGDNRFHQYVRTFGFGDRSGIALPGEVRGLVLAPQNWDKLTITRMPMGHAVDATPLQMAMAMGVVANGGNLMKPLIVREVTDRDKNVVARFEPEVVRRVISEKVAEDVREALNGVTKQGGTARQAVVEGYQVAGKTGTAQKIAEKGGYMAGKYVVSFVGFVPYEDPRFVCLVMIDEARKLNGLSNYGGTVAAPIFSRVSGRVAEHMNILPANEAIARNGETKPLQQVVYSGETQQQHVVETKGQQQQRLKQQWVQMQQEGGRR